EPRHSPGRPRRRPRRRLGVVRLHRAPDAAGARDAVRRAGASHPRARPALEGALHPDRHQLRPSPAGFRLARPRGGARQPAPARGGRVHPLPHHRPAPLLSNGGRHRGRHPLPPGAERDLGAPRRARQRDPARRALGGTGPDHERDPPAGGSGHAGPRHLGGGCPHPPRRPAGAEHPAHPRPHAVRARARGAGGAREGRGRGAADRRRGRPRPHRVAGRSAGQGTGPARRGRAGGDHHLRRSFPARPRILPVLAHDAGLARSLLGRRHPDVVEPGFGLLPLFPLHTNARRRPQRRRRRFAAARAGIAAV
ncbi:MAG: HflC protein, partial [uncultured Acetobacteraceae bacterium]